MASGRVSKVKGKVLDIPNPPTVGTATDLTTGGAVSVAFTANSSGVGGPTFSYIAKSNPSSLTATGTTSPITVSGLTDNTAYTFTVAGVNPTGTGEYSAASNSATPTPPVSIYESIATVTVGSGGAATITFSSIPQTYKHLQIRTLVRYAGNDGGYGMYYNSDTTAGNYRAHTVATDGASVYTQQMQDAFAVWGMSNNTHTTGVYNAVIMDISDYTSTSKNTTSRQLWGFDNNGSGRVGLASMLWVNTAAVTNIRLDANIQGGTSLFAQYSSFALYGIKG
jgi:hypothetical protein